MTISTGDILVESAFELHFRKISSLLGVENHLMKTAHSSLDVFNFLTPVELLVVLLAIELLQDI